MTVCPFCKKMVVNPNGGPCPSCGKTGQPSNAPAASPRAAAAAPAAGGGEDWDELEIQRGSSSTQSSNAPSSYGGGSLGGLGDDDDGGGAGISLELDTPVRSQAPAQMSAPPQAMQQQQPQPPQQPSGPPRTGASGGYPAHRDQQMPQPLPARSGRPGGSDPSMAHQQSTPNSLAPPSSSQVAIQQPQQGPQSMPSGYQGGPMAPPGAPDAAMMIARYPAPPQQWFKTPLYALKVLYRQFELRQDIDALKKKRSPDVPLYERALKTHDGMKFMIGMAINFAVFMVLTTLFFLPVIRRFAFDN